MTRLLTQTLVLKDITDKYKCHFDTKVDHENGLNVCLLVLNSYIAIAEKSQP